MRHAACVQTVNVMPTLKEGLECCQYHVSPDQGTVWYEHSNFGVNLVCPTKNAE